MRDRKILRPDDSITPATAMEPSVREEFFRPHSPMDMDSIERLVTWIEKDSTSRAGEYLEECNTHQFGE